MGNFKTQADGFFRILAAALAATLTVLCGIVLFYRFGGEAEQPQTQEVYIPEASDRMNIMIFGVDGDGEAKVCLLLGFLPDKGWLSLCALPPATLLKASGSETTLEAAFRTGGGQYAARLAAEYLETPIDRTAVCDYAAFEKLMNAGGPVEYAMTPETYAAVGNARASHGSVQLDASMAAAIMRYEKYDGGERGRSDKTAMLLSRLVGYHLTSVLTDTGRRLYKSAITAMQTDLTVEDFDSRHEAARFMAALEKPPTTVVFIDGSQAKTAYYLSESSISRIREMYGQ